MGSVFASITIRNRGDEALFERGHIGEDEIRSVTLDQVLVDTGATTLCLPASTIAALGLVLLKTVPFRTATGDHYGRVFQDAKLIIEGRAGNFECLELPDGASPLLGVLPLETLGIEPDILNHRLRLLPEEPGNTPRSCRCKLGFSSS